MSLSDFLILTCAVLLNAVAQLFLKATTDVTGPLVGAKGAMIDRALGLAAVPWFWAALACYGVSVIVWIFGLSRVPVSQAYPLLSLGYVIMLGLAWWLFGEVPNLERVVGVAVIIFGVVLVARS